MSSRSGPGETDKRRHSKVTNRERELVRSKAHVNEVGVTLGGLSPLGIGAAGLDSLSSINKKSDV